MLRPRHVQFLCAMLFLSQLLRGQDALANNGSLAIAHPVSGITVDGDHSDWPDTVPAYPIARNLWGDPIRDAEDLSASFRVGYDVTARQLFVAVELIDDSFVDSGAELDVVTVSLGGAHGATGAIGQRVWLAGSAATSTARAETAVRVAGTRRTYEFRLNVAEFELSAERHALPSVCSWTIEIDDPDDDQSHSFVFWSPETYKMVSVDRHGDILLLPEGTETGLLRGSVRSESHPYCNRIVVRLESVRDPGWVLDVRTDEFGHYSVELPVGAYRRSAPGMEVIVPCTLVVAQGTEVIDEFQLAQRTAAWHPWSVRRDTDVGEGVPVFNRIAASGSFSPRPVIRQFRPADGLPEAPIWDIAQTADGRFWLATGSGLYAFDGCRVMQIDVGDSAEARVVEVLSQNGSELVWYGSDRGGFVIDPTTESTKTILGLEQKRIHAIARAHDGSVMIGTGSGLFVSPDATASELRSVPIPRGLAAKVRAIAPDASGGLTWVGTEDGLLSYDGKSLLPQPLGDGVDRRITAVLSHHDGSLWIGTGSSLVLRQAEQIQTLLRHSAEKHWYVRRIAADRDGRIWVAALDGLHRAQSREQTTEMVVESSERLATLTFDQSGNRWTTREDVNGMSCAYRGVVQYSSQSADLVYQDGDAIWFTTLPHQGTEWALNRIARRAVKSWEIPERPLCLERHLDGLVIGTNDGVYELSEDRLKRSESPLLHSGKVLDLQTDQDGILWVVKEKGVFCVQSDGAIKDVRADLALPDERVSSIDNSLSGALALSTYRGVVIRREKAGVQQVDIGRGLSSDLAHVVRFAADGVLWIGTAEGLEAFSSNLVVERFSDRPIGRFICDDGDGDIWAGIGGGICRVSPRHRFTQVLVPQDGLGRHELRWATVDQQNIWITSDSGLFRYRKSIRQPGLVIDRIVTDRALDSVASATMTTDDPLIRFEFHGIDPAARSSGILYRYRLAGYEHEWQETPETQVQYEGLPVGRYQFEVFAVGRDLRASPRRSVTVVVSWPFARICTLTALGLSVTAALLLGAAYVHRKRRERMFLEQRVKETVREKMELTEQLHHAQKMESLGTMATGVAHDFNNVLQSITMNTELALLEGNIEGIRQLVEEIAAEADQAKELTSSLLTFGGKGTRERRPVRMAELIQSCGGMIRRTTKATIEIKVAISEAKDVFCEVDPSQIHLTIVNLCMNSCEAMPNGGKLTIDVATVLTCDGECVRICVVDTGKGIPREIRNRVFDPFFTSKKRGQGSGLGLSIVHGIVRAHGGRIEIDSALGAGTRVSIFIPTCDPPGQEGPASSVAMPAAQGSGLILIADDQTGVRRSLARALSVRGYSVIQAATGQDALELAGRHRDEIQSIVLDIDLPKINGMAVAQCLRNRGWWNNVVFITGYEGTAPEMDAKSCLLRKPFSMQKMMAVMADLDQREAGSHNED